MSLQEALLEGVQVTVVGLVIVFSVLVLLMLVLMAMKKIFYKEPQKTAPVQQAAPIEEIAAEPAMDEEELIAVLTAAVAASLNTSTYNLQIKSYRRIGQNSPAWHKAGINETINSRF